MLFLGAFFFFASKSRGPKVGDPSFESRGYEKKESHGRSASLYNEVEDGLIYIRPVG